MKPSTLILGAALAALPGSALAQYALEPLWAVAPGDRAYLANDNAARGGGYNPVTGNFYVVSRTGGNSVQVLNGQTGAQVGSLSVAGISGGTFAINMLDVGSDGAIYAANLTTASSTSPFKVYRWASEGAEPVVVYEGNPAGDASLRFGDDFRVRGGGADTQIIAGAGGSGVLLAFLTTADGTTFNAQGLTVGGIAGGDLRLGIDFLGADAIVAKQAGPARLIGYDLGAGTAELTASYTFAVPNGGGTVGPIGISPDGSLLVGYAYGTSGNSGVNSVNLYEMATLSTSDPNSPADQQILGTANANANGVGAVDFNADGSVVYVVAPNNGVAAFRVVPEPQTWALMGLGLGALAWGLRRR